MNRPQLYHLNHLYYRRRVAALLLAALLLRAILFPPAALAGCGVQDLGACVDAAQYDFWYGWAGLVWTSLDAPLLQAAYLIDVFRNWLIATAFSSAYQMLTTLLGTLIVPFAVIALLGGYILFALMPLFGRTRLMNVRHVLTWTLLAPLLLTLSGTMIAAVEQLRVELGNAIFTQVSAIAPGAIFGVSASDMADPKPLYDGSDPCGSGGMARPGGSIGGVMHMDDLAAALLWANAQDIHCPQAAGEGRDIPDAFYLDPPDGPGYASRTTVGDMPLASDRQAAVKDMLRGYSRLVLGVLPCLLAVGEALIQLLFALALIAVWVGLPFTLAFIFFEESSQSVTLLFRQGLGVLKTSWFSSFLLALLFAALRSSAEQGNAGAYMAMSIFTFFLMLFLGFVAGRALWNSVETLNQAMLMSVGVSVTEPLEAASKVAAGAAGLAVGAASGGAGLAATAAAAYNQTGSGRYAVGAALGRIQSVANVGEVAAAMGWVQDEELVGGLYAGQRSLRSAHSMRLQMQTDGRRTNAEGLTLREAAQERRIARQVERAGSDPWREINEGAAAAAGAISSGYTYMRSGQALRDVRAGRDRAFQAIGDRWQQISHAPRAFRDEVADRVMSAPIRHPASDLVHAHAAAIAVVHDHLAPDQRYHAYRLDEHGKLQAEQPRSGAALPAGATTLPNVHVNVTRLLRQGYVVQQNDDKTVTFWHGDPQKAAAAQANPDQERAQLAKVKAITEEGVKLAMGASSGSSSQSTAPTLPGNASGQATPAGQSPPPAASASSGNQNPPPNKGQSGSGQGTP